MTEFYHGTETPIPPFFYEKDYNVNGQEVNKAKLSHENELIEYFVTLRGDDMTEVERELHIDVNIEDNEILRDVMRETTDSFRNILRDAVTMATILINYDRDDMVLIALKSRQLRNRITINMEFPVNITLGELTASDYEGHIVTFDAKVNNWSKIRTVTYTADYKCPDCGQIISRPFKPKIKDKCPTDNTVYEFHRPTSTEDTRRVVFREINDDFTEGKLPASINADVYGKTVWEIELSDKVTVTGIYRSVPLKMQDGKISQEFIPTIQVIGIQNQKINRLETPDMELMKKFQDLEVEGKLIDAIIDGYSYNIYKKKMEKKALICSIIGSRWIGQIGSGNPPMIHILFVGDPETYKSTMMKYVMNVSDNCVLADATTVSNAGIKAIAVKMDDGRMSIMAGLLPTHSGGIVYLDEFGDMKQDIYADLKAPMIDGRVSKHVAGEDFNGLAETGIWASMNPIEGVYEEDKTIYENLAKLGKPLITRFDVIFKFPVDFNNMYEDQISEHMMNYDHRGKPDGILKDREIKLFLNYVKNLTPEITMESLKRNNDFFADIKRNSEDKKNVGTRTKNAVMKFAVAIAKWHMSNQVLAIHVNEALELYKASLETFGMKFENGEFIDVTTLKKTEDGRRTAIRKSYEKLRDEHGYAFEDEVVDEALTHKCFVSRGHADALIQTMRLEGRINTKDKMIKIDWK